MPTTNPDYALDPWEHIIKTTFDPEDFTKVARSHHSKIRYEERKHKQKMAMMVKNNMKIVKDRGEKMDLSASKGVFYCPEVQSSTGVKCMCAFSTKTGLRNHQSRGKHNFPTFDLASMVHDLHTSGNFAFSLATVMYKRLLYLIILKLSLVIDLTLPQAQDQIDQIM